MSQASSAADASADARHSFDEVGIGEIFALFEQCHAACLYAVARACFKLEVVESVFLQTFRNGIRKTSAACENSSEIRCVIENVLFKPGYIYLTAVEKRLKLLEGHCNIDILCDLRLLHLGFFRRAGSDKHDLCGGFVLLDILCDGCHR